MTLADFLRTEIEAGQFPGGAALVGTGDRVLEFAAAGHAALLPAEAPLGQETLFDLASLTKPMTAMAVARWGALRSSRLGSLLPAARGTPSENATMEQLLAHRAGLEANLALFRPLMEGRGVVLSEDHLRRSVRLVNAERIRCADDLGREIALAVRRTTGRRGVAAWCIEPVLGRNSHGRPCPTLASKRTSIEPGAISLDA